MPEHSTPSDSIRAWNRAEEQTRRVLEVLRQEIRGRGIADQELSFRLGKSRSFLASHYTDKRGGIRLRLDTLLATLDLLQCEPVAFLEDALGATVDAAAPHQTVVTAFQELLRNPDYQPESANSPDPTSLVHSMVHALVEMAKVLGPKRALTEVFPVAAQLLRIESQEGHLPSG